MIEILSKNEQDTKRLGMILSEFLTSNDTVLISGDLGAGKTVLVKGIAKGFNIEESLVHSPSYIYINKYEGDIEINHIDLYLLNEYSDINHIGYGELEGEELCLIEWGDKFSDINSEDKWNLHIAYKQDQCRLITISLPEEKKALEERIIGLWHI